jgi:hypothetical protein
MKQIHSPSSLPPPTHEQITQRAHRLWIEAGRPEGRDREHWAEAERQLRDPSSKRRREDKFEAEKRLDGLIEPPPDERSPSQEQL